MYFGEILFSPRNSVSRKPEQRRYRALCLHGALWVLVGGLLVSGAYDVSASPAAAGDVGRLPAYQALQGTETVSAQPLWQVGGHTLQPGTR